MLTFHNLLLLMMILARIFESLKACSHVYLSSTFSILLLSFPASGLRFPQHSSYLSSFLDSTEQLDFFLVSAFLFSIKMCLFCGAAAESILLYFLLLFGWLVDQRSRSDQRSTDHSGLQILIDVALAFNFMFLIHSRRYKLRKSFVPHPTHLRRWSSLR